MALTARTAARLWLAAGLLGLAAIWWALRFAPEQVEKAGFAFLFSPVVITLVTMYRTLRHDRRTAFGALVLVVLFLFAWFS